MLLKFGFCLQTTKQRYNSRKNLRVHSSLTITHHHGKIVFAVTNFSDNSAFSLRSPSRITAHCFFGRISCCVSRNQILETWQIMFNLARLADPSYDTGPYASIRPRGDGYGVRGSRHIVTLPRNPSEKLAILYGLVCGDGSLMSYESAAKQGKWRIDFAESDPTVVSEYARLTQELFHVSPIVRNRETWFETYYCSKVAYRFYSRVLGHPTGRKTGLLKIPDSFKHRSGLLLGFLRGLFTAEGSIKVERNIRIALEMQERLLVRETASILADADFYPHLYSYSRIGRRVYGLYVDGLDEAKLFHRKIGFVGRKGLRLSKVISQFERRQL